MKTKHRTARDRPVEVGKIIRALSKRPLTVDELNDATGIAFWLLRHVLANLEGEEAVDHGYPEDPQESVAARYWLTWDPPGCPEWLEDEGEDDDAVTAEDVDHDMTDEDDEEAATNVSADEGGDRRG
jgi:hypothetical protein